MRTNTEREDDGSLSFASVRAAVEADASQVWRLATAAHEWMSAESARTMFPIDAESRALLWEDSGGQVRIALAWCGLRASVLADPGSAFMRDPARGDERIAALESILEAAGSANRLSR